MLDTTDKAYTLYNYAKVIDEVAYRLICDGWYGYTHNYKHFASIETVGKTITISFNSFSGYHILLTEDDTSFYDRINWKRYTGNVSEDVECVYNFIVSLIQMDE